MIIGGVTINNPTHGDGRVLGNNAKINRTMSGAVYTYRRYNYKFLTLSFVNIDVTVVESIIALIDGTTKTMTDYNGDEYNVVITSDPVSLQNAIETCGGKYVDFTLDLELVNA